MDILQCKCREKWKSGRKPCSATQTLILAVFDLNNEREWAKRNPQVEKEIHFGSEANWTRSIRRAN